jgi:hypothetical protein
MTKYLLSQRFYNSGKGGRAVAFCRLFFLSFLAPEDSLFAQSRVVNIKSIEANYTVAPPTITFEVYWTSTPTPPMHRDTVWVFADYQAVGKGTELGAWAPAGMTKVAVAGAGTVVPHSLNGRGFYLAGNPSGAFSSTVTVTLNEGLAGTKFNWCAYATDYPPNAQEDKGYYALLGTPPFRINDTVVEPTRQYRGGCIERLSDATGCPGLVPALPVVRSLRAAPERVCSGDSVTLTAAATGAASYSFDAGRSWQREASVRAAPRTDTAYTVAVCNAAGCTVGFSAAASVTVPPNPALSFSKTTATACADSVVTLVATGGVEYCFRQSCPGCRYSSGPPDTTNFCTFGASGSYSLTMPREGRVTVWVRAKNEWGCVDSISTAIDARPGGALRLVSGATTTHQSVCAGVSIDTIVYAGTGIDTAWVDGIEEAAGLQAVWNGERLFIFGASAVPGAYQYTVVGSGRCGNARGIGDIHISAFPAVPSDFPKDQVVCVGLLATLTMPPAEGISYTWYSADGAEVATGNSYSTASAGSYYAVGRNADGCTARSRVAAVSTEAIGRPVISGNASNACPGQDYQVELTRTGASCAQSYEWYRDGQEVYVGTDARYLAKVSGTYTVRGVSNDVKGPFSEGKAVFIRDCIFEHCGIHMYQTSQPYDARAMSLKEANQWCQERGARLPTDKELTCMCNNSGSLPGGSIAYSYWSNYNACRLYTCQITYTAVAYFRCVK